MGLCSSKSWVFRLHLPGSSLSTKQREQRPEEHSVVLKLGECPICFEDMKPDTVMVLPCGHEFHLKCLREWWKRKTTCPMCRVDITKI